MSVRRLLRNGLRFWRAYGTRNLLRELQRRLTTPLPPGMASGPSALPPPKFASSWQPPTTAAQAMLAARFNMLSPLPVFVVPSGSQPRVSLITDSVNRGSFFGGVATTLIIAALLAQRRGARLRVITRVEPAQGANLQTLFEIYGLKLEGEVEFAFAHVNATQTQVNVERDELFITSSWWSTRAALASIAPQRLLYVLQEDERSFYPAGEDHLRCHQLIAEEGVHVAVNTDGLLRHLVADGLPGLAPRAVAFEPAFPARLFHPRPKPASSQGRRRLMFYARPIHLRNLFYFGLEVLDRAVAIGLIDSRRWEIHFVGAGVPPVTLCDGSEPVRHEQLGWREYIELVGTIDLGLSLMISPHPSYPPLDLAASGAVVVSNRWGNKTDLSHLCGNIVLGELTMDSMLDALRRGLALVDDEAERARRHRSHRLGAEWPEALAPVLERFGHPGDAWTRVGP
jgi:hypothetical protein